MANYAINVKGFHQPVYTTLDKTPKVGDIISIPHESKEGKTVKVKIVEQGMQSRSDTFVAEKID